MLKFSSVRFAYRANGKGYTVTTDSSVSNKRINLNIDEVGDTIKVSVSTKSPIEIVRLTAEFEYDFPEDSRIFLNGYQSWTDSAEHGKDGKLRGIDHIPAPLSDKYSFSAYGDYDFVKYSRSRGNMHGFSYGYIKHGIGDLDFIGSLNENEGFTVIRTDTAKGTVTAEKECSGLNVTESYSGLSLYIGEGSEDEVFDRYFELMDIAPTAEKPVFGYTSWYRHYQNINETVLSEDLEGLKNCGVKADIFQIDDGYQTAVGDWLSVDTSKFQSGMKEISDRIKAEDMIPGLWLAPFVCEEKSDIFKNNKDWLLKDENGAPVKAGGNWSGAYALDIYNEEFREYLKQVFDTVINEWGFRLLKLDFLYAACILPREDKTRGMIMSEGVDLLRELAGDAKILGCGVPLASAFGKFEYCRIGTDVTPEWDDKAYMQLLHRERPSTRLTILNSVFRRQLNGRAFINDPDVFMLRSTDTSMTLQQRKCLAEINVLCGGVLFNSDNMNEYGEKQKELLSGMLELRGAKVLDAQLNGGELVLSVEKDGKYGIKSFKLGF